MSSKISALTDLAAPLSTDVVAVADLTASQTKKATLAHVVASSTPKLHASTHSLAGGTDPVLPTVFTVSTTGNIDDLDFSNADLIRFTNASLSTLRGLKAGSPGQRVGIISAGAGIVAAAHQNAGSVAANRLQNYVSSVDTPCAAGIGTMMFQYDGTSGFWRLIAHEQGDFIQVAYNSGNFTASSGTWTVDSGDQLTFGYWIRGRDCFYNIDIASSTNTGGQVTMRVTLTGMPIIAFSSFSVVWASDGGVDITTLVGAETGTNTRLNFYKFGGGNWNANTNTLRITATGHYAIT